MYFYKKKNKDVCEILYLGMIISTYQVLSLDKFKITFLSIYFVPIPIGKKKCYLTI